LSEVLNLRDDPTTFALKQAAIRSEHHLQILRSYRPGGWNPTLKVEGEFFLRDALQAGYGAVLWVAHFGFNALATKVALGRAGFGVHHLSRPEHGFSKSRFGIRFLNPIRVHAELPHLAGRVIIDRSQSSKAKGEAERILGSNGIISITAGAWEGRRIAIVELFDGTIEVATGAPSLAISSGAALLPVFTVRDEKTGAIRVIVDAPIAQTKEGDKLEKIDRMSQEFADRLKAYIVEYPEQWRDWKSLQVGPG
jgi:lauroyl/myristoyl acyltransferase